MHYFKINQGLKTEFVTKKNLLDSFVSNDARLSDDQLGYVIRFLFNITQNLFQLPYLEIFAFLTEKQKEYGMVPPTTFNPNSEL